MSRNFVAFDLEIAKQVPGPEFNWKPHRPLGISCAATVRTGDDAPRLWFDQATDGKPAPAMRRESVQALVAYLAESLAGGYLPVTWNGLAFDYDILAEESGHLAACREQALAHVDMMFHVLCDRGFPVSLDNAAKGMGLAGKSPGMTGIDAPVLWARGEYDKVLDYVGQDVRTTLALAEAGDRTRTFRWLTRRGTTSDMRLPRGWLTVGEALKLPLPDTSWMETPPRREDYVRWTTPPG